MISVAPDRKTINDRRQRGIVLSCTDGQVRQFASSARSGFEGLLLDRLRSDMFCNGSQIRSECDHGRITALQRLSLLNAKLEAREAGPAQAENPSEQKIRP